MESDIRELEGWPSVATNRHPFRLYAQLRGFGAVVRHPLRDEYLVTTDEHVRLVLRIPEVFSNDIDLGGDPEQFRTSTPLEHSNQMSTADPAGRLSTSTLTRSDPPEHTVKRSAVRRIVERDRLTTYEPLIRQLVDSQIDTFAERGEADFCRTFSLPLAFRLICTLLGLRTDEAERYWTHGNPGTGHGARYLSEQDLRKQFERVEASQAFLAEILAERAERPGTDFLSIFVRDGIVRDGELRLDYLSREAGLLLRAGNETTARLLANTMMMLLDHPGQLAALRRDPSGIPAIIEEVLRLESPTQWISRRCVRDFEVGGVTIPAGATVVALLASGNRDPARWGEDADAFTPRRPAAAGHLAFGYGPHLCLGAPLARMESRIAFERLLDRLPTIRYHGDHRGTTENIDNIQKRAPKELWIEFEVVP